MRDYYIKLSDAIEICEWYRREYTECEAALSNLANEMQRLHPADVVEQPRWIPATERLPKDGVEVLCWREYRHWTKGKVFSEYGIGYQYNGLWDFGKVLAWLPLPELPKEVDIGDGGI